MTPRRPVLRWHGGKWLLAPWIIDQMPPHRTYTEAFGGAASVLLRKPRVYCEVYNDLDGEVVNLFRVLQRPPDAARLRELLLVIPFAREEYRKAFERTDDPVERARRLLVRSFMGFGSNSHNVRRRSGFRSNSERSGTVAAHDWAAYPGALDLVVARFRGVVIENRPAELVLREHDRPGTLHYVDPPYPVSTRGDGKEDYAFEMTDDDHRALAGVLRGLRGMVLLSGYPCALYDEELYPDWARIEREHLVDGARRRREVLWMNAALRTQAPDLFRVDIEKGGPS